MPDKNTPIEIDGEKVAPLRKPVPCPICKKQSARSHYPFCSKHCADVDLSRWFNGNYAVPVVETDPSSDNFPEDER